MNFESENNDNISRSTTRESRKHIMLNQYYFEKWRFFRLFGAVLGALAIIPITIDYEIGYSEIRTISTCKFNSDHNILLRLLGLSTSILGIISVTISKFFYFRYLNTSIWTFQELPPTVKLSYLDAINRLRRRKIKEYFFESELQAITFLFLIIPYPGMHTEIFLSQQILYEQVTICYYLEEIFYFFMFTRLIYLVLTVFGYGRFQSVMARWSCERNRTLVSSEFSLKCYAWIYPVHVLVFLFLIPGVLVFGIGMRIFERPLHVKNMDLSYLPNTMWCIVVTMTTVGYGDTIITSNLARLVTCLAIFWGGIILSLTFVTLGSFLKLKKNEETAFRAISVARESVEMIENSFCKKKGISGRSNGWDFLMEKVKINAIIKRKLIFSNIQYRKGLIIATQLQNVNEKAYCIEKKLKKILKNMG